jgi:hypothetical protein
VRYASPSSSVVTRIFLLVELMSFLAEYELRPLILPEVHDLKPVGLGLGNGPNALEVAIAASAEAPRVKSGRGDCCP